MVTARAEEVDRVLGLKLGQMIMWSNPLARESRCPCPGRSAAERRNHRFSEVLRVGDIVLDIGSHEVTVGGRPIYMTPTEFNILPVLHAHLEGHYSARN